MKSIPIPDLAGFDGYVWIASHAALADEAYLTWRGASGCTRKWRTGRGSSTRGGGDGAPTETLA